MRLTELLDIDVNSKKIISVVGGGGKTSLIFRLAEELAEQGIHPNTIRLSVGTEHIDDILEDLELAFQAVAER